MTGMFGTSTRRGVALFLFLGHLAYGPAGGRAMAEDMETDVLDSERDAPASVPQWLDRARRLDEARLDRLDLVSELITRNIQRDALQNLLGDNRWRSLDEARFLMEMDSLGFTRDLREDHRHEMIKDALRSNFFKVARENLEDILRVDEFWDRTVMRLRPGRHSEEVGSGARTGNGLRISPRFSMGDDPEIGAKLRLHGWSSPLWSSLSFRFEQGLRSNEQSFKLQFEDRKHEFYLEYVTHDRYAGELLEMNLRYSW